MNVTDYVDGMRELGFEFQVAFSDLGKPAGLSTMFPSSMPTGKTHEKWKKLQAWQLENCTTNEIAMAIVAGPTTTTKQN